MSTRLRSKLGSGCTAASLVVPARRWSTSARCHPRLFASVQPSSTTSPYILQLCIQVHLHHPHSLAICDQFSPVPVDKHPTPYTFAALLLLQSSYHGASAFEREQSHRGQEVSEVGSCPSREHLQGGPITTAWLQSCSLAKLRDRACWPGRALQRWQAAGGSR